MKVVNVSEFKAHLSRYLRQAARGARIVVADRDEPIAQLGPLDAPASDWSERLAAEGALRRGTQKWSELKISATRNPTDIQASLQAVREEPSEVRRRKRPASNPVR
jgi:antitoxin (DNA-binding transcriptional repressor) of toxin-antitoxin stability system